MVDNRSSVAEERDGYQLAPGAAPSPDGAEAEPRALVPAHLVVLARRIATARRVRDRVFGPGMFIDPPWNMLVELFVAGEEGRSVTIKSACVAGGVPQSTALRHIAHLVDIGLCVRSQHPSDARSVHLKLTAAGHAQMVEFLRDLAEAVATGG